MPRFFERYYSLDLKKSADFGSAKAVYTLRCRLISYGTAKETKNLILTPLAGEGQGNYTQWNSLQTLLKNENVLLFSYRDLRRFFIKEEYETFVAEKKHNSLEIQSLCDLFLFYENISTPDALNDLLTQLIPTRMEQAESSPEKTLESLGRLLSGFDPGLRSTVISLLSATHPPLADWLDSLREQVRELPSRFQEPFRTHFVSLKDERGAVSPENSEDPLKKVFADDGGLKNILGDYEHRPEQLHMARLFAQAIDRQEMFIAEAGTGTGKSLAYLIPAILRITDHDEKAVVATYTKTLQSQLFFNDFRLAAEACGRKISAALLKGRANYLCLLKKAMLKSRLRTHLAPEDYYDLAKIEIWESLTKSGDLAEINLDNRKLIGQISAESNFCLKQSCQFYSKCYFYKARKQASRAGLVIINQALFFSDMLSEGSLLGNRQLLIFDEAHRLEKTATAHLGGELERFFPLSVLNGLWLKREQKQSLLTLIEILAAKIGPGEELIPSDSFELVRKLTSKARNALDEIFEKLRIFQTEKGYVAETFPIKLRFKSNDEIFARISIALDEMAECLKGLGTILIEMYSTLTACDLDLDERILVEDFYRSTAQLAGIGKSVETFAECNSDQYVFWLEISNRGFNALKFAPLDVSEDLNKMIYERYPSILFTSASLSVEGYFDFFERQIGLDRQPGGQVIRKSFGSSFDFYSQIDFLCPVYLASPKSEFYTSALAKFIGLVIPSFMKKALVLCTSNQLVADLYYQTGRKLQSGGFDVFAQAVSGTAEQILRDFRQSPLAVIFGTDSFWEGIDLPGAQLELLIITRLPFATPSEPVEAARMERLEKNGENSFVSYSLPNAVLKFKQGFGRLIRQKSDTGSIIVTDNRLVKSNFGQIFLSSVPAELNVLYSQDELMDKLN
jgi:ATP-dependent DNA helicase DinG